MVPRTVTLEASMAQAGRADPRRRPDNLVPVAAAGAGLLRRRRRTRRPREGGGGGRSRWWRRWWRRELRLTVRGLGRLVRGGRRDAAGTDHSTAGVGDPHQPDLLNSPGPDTATNQSLNAEFVRLKNTSRTAQQLRGWRISDLDGHAYRLGALRLRPGASVTVHSGHGRDTSHTVEFAETTGGWDP